ncbi:MAG TPA: TorF family putative porin [Sphingomicrobium sp.]
MWKFSAGVFPLLALVGSAPAAAADLGGGLSLNGGATLISDYRFRGISQTNKRFAVQGTFTISHSSGFYGTVWGSSIDDYVANGGDAELDLIFGYKKTFKSTTIDGGVLYYYYPGSGGANTDFAEPYVRVTQAFGPVSVTGNAAYAPKQKGISIDGIHKEDNLYVAGDLSYSIPKTPVALTGHLGHSYGPSYLTIGNGYTDWSLGAVVTVKNLTAGLSYVDTNKSLYSPRGRNIAGAGVVASLGVTF